MDPDKSSTQAENPIACILVHGTWAPRASWTLPGSALRRAIEEELRNRVRLERFAWSGRNSHGARTRAARRLALQLKHEFRSDRVVLIAHSHGGNVCAQALRDLGDDPRIIKLICLSTPFLVERLRDVSRLGRSLFMLMPGAPLILLYGIWVAKTYPPWWLALPILPLVWLLGRTLGLAWLSFCNYLKPHFWYPGPDRLMIVRMPGDEASSAIAVAGFLNWIVFQLWNVVRIVPGSLLAVGWILHSRMALAGNLATRGLAYPCRIVVDLVGFAVAIPAAVVALLAMSLSWVAGAGHVAIASIYFSIHAEPSPPGTYTIYQFLSRTIEPLDESPDRAIGRPLARYHGKNRAIAEAHEKWHLGPDLFAPILAHSEAYDHPEVLEFVVRTLKEVTSIATASSRVRRAGDDAAAQQRHPADGNLPPN